MRDAAKQEQDQGKTPENRCIINVSGFFLFIGLQNSDILYIWIAWKCRPGQLCNGYIVVTCRDLMLLAKLGIVGLTKTVAKEWGMFGIRCNAIAFGKN